MIDCLYAFICEKVLLDQPTRLASYINVIPGGIVDTLPKDMPPLWLATCWMGTGKPVDEFLIRVSLRSPDDASRKIIEMPVKDQVAEGQKGKVRRHVANIHVGSFKVEQEGLHFFDVEFKVTKSRKGWQKCASIPINVELKEPPATKGNGFKE